MAFCLPTCLQARMDCVTLRWPMHCRYSVHREQFIGPCHPFEWVMPRSFYTPCCTCLSSSQFIPTWSDLGSWMASNLRPRQICPESTRFPVSAALVTRRCKWKEWLSCFLPWTKDALCWQLLRFDLVSGKRRTHATEIKDPWHRLPRTDCIDCMSTMQELLACTNNHQYT